MDEALGVEVFGKELDDGLMLQLVVELELGIGEAFVERHIGIRSVLFHGDRGDVAFNEPFGGFAVRHISGRAGEDDPSKLFVGKRIVVFDDPLEASMRTGTDHGNVARLQMSSGFKDI